MLGDRPACGVGERSHAKVADLAPREVGGPLDKILRFFIQPESEAFDAVGRFPFDLGLFARHWGHS